MAVAEHSENIELQEEDTNYENEATITARRIEVEMSAEGHYDRLDLQNTDDAVYEVLQTKTKRETDLEKILQFVIAVAVCLGMLCLLLLGVNIGQAVLYHSPSNNMTNGTLVHDCNQLKTNYDTLTLENTQLKSNYDTLTLENTQLKSNYDNLTLENTQLKIDNNHLLWDKNQLTTKYNALIRENNRPKTPVRNDDICCTSFYPKRLPSCNVVTFQRTPIHCARDGIEFTMKNGARICADPTVQWVQDIISCLSS